MDLLDRRLLQFGVLGPLSLGESGGADLVVAPKLRSLVAALLTSPGAVVSTDALIDMVWVGRPPRAALQGLRVYVHELRRVLGEHRIEHSRGGYRLVLEEGELDSERFRRQREQARQKTDPVVAAAGYRAALALWRGPVFVGFEDAEPIRAVAQALDESRLDVLEERFAVELELGRHGEVLVELGALAREYPLRERFRAQLMLALVRADRRAEALAGYDESRRHLAQQYGLDPSPGVAQLHRRILLGDPQLYPRPAVPVDVG